MLNSEFERVVKHRLDKCQEVLIKKGKEYSKEDGDRLEHFYKAAYRRGNKGVGETLMGMKVKHTICIDDMVEKMDSGELLDREQIEEKFTDEINYLLLLEALLIDNGILRSGEEFKEKPRPLFPY
jgi:hypothetical protein